MPPPRSRTTWRFGKASSSSRQRTPWASQVACDAIFNRGPESRAFVRIVSWNIRAGGGVRAERIARQLTRWSPSVVVLSEFRATPPSRALAASLRKDGLVHQRTTARADRAPTNALLVASKWPLRRLAASFGAEEPCRWLAVRVASPQPFSLGALHVPCKVSGRKDAFHDALISVAARWRRRPAILVGDSNSGLPGIDEQAPCFGAREQAFFESIAELDWSDAFRHRSGEARAYTWYSPNGDNGFRLDQGFVSPRLLPRLARVFHSWPGGRRCGLSDHAALLIDFSAGTAA